MKIQEKDYFSDDLKNTNWLGEVILNEDFENVGRVKIKVFGKFDLLEEEQIPWAYPANHITAGSATGSGFYSVPKIGSIVNVYFDNGNIYHPIYTYHQKLSDELIEEIGDDHQSFHSLMYDTNMLPEGEEEGEIPQHLKIYYSRNEEKGFFINTHDTIVNLRNDNTFIFTNPNTDTISITNEGIMDMTINDICTFNITNQYDINTIVTNIVSEDEYNMQTTAWNVTAEDTTVDTSNSYTVNTTDATISASGSTVIESPKIDLGGGASEPVVLGDTLKGLLDELIDALMQMTHPTGVGPSGPPINVASFTAVKAKLQTMLSMQNKTL